MSPILSSNTTNSPPSTPVTGPIIFRTILQNPTLAFFSIHQLLLTVNLIFYKRNKAVLGFLDEEEMGIKYVQTDYEHNTAQWQRRSERDGVRKRGLNGEEKAEVVKKGFVAVRTYDPAPSLPQNVSTHCTAIICLSHLQTLSSDKERRSVVCFTVSP